MSDELRPCPFCGEKPTTGGSTEMGFPQYAGCYNEKCLAQSLVMPIKVWNRRPTEDALKAENAKKTSLLKRLAWACWNADNREELTDEISGDLYSELLEYFPATDVFNREER